MSAADKRIKTDAMSGLRGRLGHVWEDVCNFIIRPDRAEYKLSDLGPPLFRISDSDRTLFQRLDMELENMRGMKIQCSWYQPLRQPKPCTPPAEELDRDQDHDDEKENAVEMKTNQKKPQKKQKTMQMKSEEENEQLPCLVYLHGNSSSRYDGLEVLHVLRHGFTLFTYDACGSGMSDGDHVSLGFYERQDLAAVVDFLHGCKRVSAIGLWGRSMGAVTSIMYASKDPSIRCIICDSPFSSLRKLAEDLVEEHGKWVPNKVVELAVEKVRKEIAKKAHFDINDLDPVRYAEQCACPSFFFHGRDDDFVKPYHSLRIEEHYGGSCLHRLVDGGHNDSRGADVQRIAIPFLKLYMVEKVEAEKRERSAKEAELRKKAVAEEAGALINNNSTATLDTAASCCRKEDNQPLEKDTNEKTEDLIIVDVPKEEEDKKERSGTTEAVLDASSSALPTQQQRHMDPSGMAAAGPSSTPQEGQAVVATESCLSVSRGKEEVAEKRQEQQEDEMVGEHLEGKDSEQQDHQQQETGSKPIKEEAPTAQEEDTEAAKVEEDGKKEDEEDEKEEPGLVVDGGAAGQSSEEEKSSLAEAPSSEEEE